MSETDESETRSEQIVEGERYARSPVSAEWYRVTRWRDLGDGKIVALEKEQVRFANVPLEAIAEAMADELPEATNGE